jgi:uncharacterized protein with HEPN domain
MSLKRVYLDYIRDRLENTEKAIRFVTGMNFEEFTNDEKITYAVVRALKVIGEAIKKSLLICETNIQKYPGETWRGPGTN